MRARTMVYLDREQLQGLRTEARSKGISLAELIRQVVQRHLEGQAPPPAPPPAAYLKFVAMGSSGRHDVAERHDQYLGEALSREHAR